MFFKPDFLKDGGDVSEIRWIFLIIGILFGALIYWSSMRLKRVTLDGEVLRISNYRSEIVVHLRDIERVTGSILMNPELVWLHFRMPTEFGTKIVFMGKSRFFSGFTRHPVVKELRELIWKASTGKKVAPYPIT